MHMAPAALLLLPRRFALLCSDRTKNKNNEKKEQRAHQVEHTEWSRFSASCAGGGVFTNGAPSIAKCEENRGSYLSQQALRS